MRDATYYAIPTGFSHENRAAKTNWREIREFAHIAALNVSGL
jgi:hypothetical protein